MNKPSDKYKDYMIDKHKSEYSGKKKSWSEDHLRYNPTWEQMELDLGINFPVTHATNTYPKFPKKPYTAEEFEALFFDVLAKYGWKKDGECLTLICKICDDRIMTIEHKMIGAPNMLTLEDMSYPHKWIGKHNLGCKGKNDEE